MSDSKVEIKSITELQKMVSDLETVSDAIQRVQIAKKFIILRNYF